MKNSNKISIFVILIIIGTIVVLYLNQSKKDDTPPEKENLTKQESKTPDMNIQEPSEVPPVVSEESTKIVGTINFDGATPSLKVIQMNADPTCVKNNQGQEVKAHSLVLGPNKTVANVLVQIKSGLPIDKPYQSPAKPIVLDQIGCMYVPHVVAVMKNQPVNILNSDGTLHNVHGLPKINDEFNLAMPKFKKQIEKKFEKAESPFKVKCDVHPWMGGYVAVMDHPYFWVTKEDGKFEISGLPGGDYEIEIWHEKLGTQTARVIINSGETKTQDFTLTKTKQTALNTVMIIR